MIEPLIATTERRLIATVRDLTGVLADTTMVCTVKDPAGVSTTPPVVHDSTGVYHSDVVFGTAGTWYVEWQGTGAIIVAGDTAITVRGSYVDG